MNHRVQRIAAATLILLTLVTFLPAMRGGFIWDDDDHLTQNPAVASPNGLRQIWSSLDASRYYPLTLTTFWLQRRVWGLKPMPYHVFNISLHAVNAVLLYHLLKWLRAPSAWLAAAIWAVHPINVESVAWITELKNTQSGFFFFLALLCWLQFEAQQTGQKRRTWYTLGLLAFAASMLSKSSTVILPAVLLLWAWWQHGRWQRADFLRTAPFFALAIGMSLLTIAEQRVNIQNTATQEWTLRIMERFIVAGKSLWFYAVKILWPHPVMFIYPRWEIQTNSFAAWLPLIATVAVGLGLWRLRHQFWARVALFGVSYFLLALLPVLGFIDVYFFRYSFVADHFQYLASVGIIALVVAGAAHGLDQAAPSWKRKTGISFSMIVLATLGILTARQSALYADSETLFRATVAYNPACWMAHNNLGGIYLERGRLDEAIEHLEEVLRYRNDDAGVYRNLGTAFFRQGKFVEAIAQYEQSIRLDPNDAGSRYDVGNGLFELGRYDEASAQYENALRLKPNYAEADYNLANTRLRQGRPQEALDHYGRAVQIAPDDVEMRFTFAGCLAQQNKLPEAAAHYQRVLQIKPDFTTAHYNLANTLMHLGRSEEAIAHYRQAVQLEPDLLPAHFNMATALLGVGNASEAIQHLQQVLALKPDLAQAHYQLSVAWAKLGNFERATNCCDRALRLNAELPQALADCAWLLATHKEATSQGVKRAIELARHVCSLTGTNDPSYLDVLAAAYAADGQFSNAVVTAERAFALADATEKTQLKQEIGDRLSFYRNNKPYRAVTPEVLPSDW